MRSVSTSVKEVTFYELQKQADEEKRTLSNMIRIILEGHVEETKSAK